MVIPLLFLLLKRAENLSLVKELEGNLPEESEKNFHWLSSDFENKSFQHTKTTISFTKHQEAPLL